MMKFVIGKHAVENVIQLRIAQEIYITSLVKHKNIVDLCKKHNVKYSVVTNHALNNLLKHTKHQGCCAVNVNYSFVREKSMYDALQQTSNQTVVILDHITDPHNFGSLIRTSYATGVDWIVIPNHSQIKLTETISKTSAGYLFNMKIVEVSSLENTINNLKNLKFEIFGINKIKNAESLYKHNFTKSNKALIFGNEGVGIQKSLITLCNHNLYIPMKNNVESLNVSNAFAIVTSYIQDI